MCDACNAHPDTDIITELDKAHPIIKAHFEALKEQRDALFNIAWLPEDIIRAHLKNSGQLSDEIADAWLDLIRRSGRTDFYNPETKYFRGAIVEAYHDIQEKYAQKRGWITPDGSLNYFQMKQDGLDVPQQDELPPLD